MEKLIKALLTDEHGISEEAYNALYEYLDTLTDTEEWSFHAALQIRNHGRAMLSLIKSAEATDGRFYFTS